MGKKKYHPSNERHWVNYEKVKTVFSKAEPEQPKIDKSDTISHKSSFEISFNLIEVFWWIFIFTLFIFLCSGISVDISVW